MDRAAPPTEARLVLALVVVQVAFGGMSVAGKLVLPFVPPLVIALCRLGVAAALLFALERALVRAPLPPRRDLAALAGLALLGVVLNQGLFLTGLSYTSATNAVLLIATIPAFTLLVAVLLRQESTTPTRLAGLALSFGGVALLVGRDGLDLTGGTLGNVLILLNSLSYSAYLVLSRPILARHDPLTVIAWVFILGFCEMVLVAGPQALAVGWGALPTEAWAGFAYVILAATVLSYGLNTWVLRHVAASRVASFVYLQPLVGAAAAAIILGETFDLWSGAAALLILGGVALANLAWRSRRAGAPF